MAELIPFRRAFISATLANHSLHFHYRNFISEEISRSIELTGLRFSNNQIAKNLKKRSKSNFEMILLYLRFVFRRNTKYGNYKTKYYTDNQEKVARYAK
ncbi:MAG: hypothetical protein HC831_19290, partial [Chloroflexia bacterium]|nr:hypothetical protein [Chloroflexia bacterium]